MLTSGNSKLKKDGIWTFSLPVGQTCPRAGECRKWCYASVGKACMPSVKAHRQHNYEASLSDSFVDDMISELKRIQPTIVRIHDSGDFYDEEYCAKWRDIIEACPGVTFYAYSKSWLLVESAGLTKLSNFTLLPSRGGLDDDLLGERNVALVISEVADVPVNSVEGSDSDLQNLLNFQQGLSIALRAHGARRRKVA
jgi:hypothetical protein